MTGNENNSSAIIRVFLGFEACFSDLGSLHLDTYFCSFMPEKIQEGRKQITAKCASVLAFL